MLLSNNGNMALISDLEKPQARSPRSKGQAGSEADIPLGLGERARKRSEEFRETAPRRLVLLSRISRDRKLQYPSRTTRADFV